MTEGGQALTTKRLAIKVETAGARATAPTLWMIAGGKITPKYSKGFDKRDVSGNRDPVLSTRKPEEFSISIPMFALIEDNGLGELLFLMMGTDTTSAEIGSSTAYDHVLTANDTIKTFTLWLYDTLDVRSARLCTIEKMTMDIDRSGGIEFVFDVKGTDIADDSNWGSASYVNVATAKSHLIPGSQTILEWGQPQSNASLYWEKISLSVSENPAYGANGKAAVPAGASSPKLAVKGAREWNTDIEFIEMDKEEQQRWWQGGDTDPSATAAADVQALSGYRIRAFGSQTKAGTIGTWYYAHHANVGSVTLTMGGTYNGGVNTPAMYEIKCSTDSTADKFMWRKNGGTWSAEVEVTAGAMTTLGDGLEVTFSSTSGMTLGDTYYIFSHYQRMIEVTSPYNVIDTYEEPDSDNFYKGKIGMYYEGGPSSTKPSLTLRNTKSSAYTG